MINLNSHRLYHVLQLLVWGLGLFLIYQLANLAKWRLDLTEEKRYTLSDQTKSILSRLESEVYIEVYLAGELPSNFQRFQKSIGDMLLQFRDETPVQFDFKWVDPAQAESQQARNQYFQGLAEKGLQPTNLSYTADGQTSQKLIFPGAILYYQGQEIAVNLLKGSRTSDPETIINQSIEGLEYELINALVQASSPTRKKIGFVTGHNEPDTMQLAGFSNAILSKYDLYRINLPDRTAPLMGYDAIIIGKPTTAFSEVEKYLLDQYLMKGGKLLFFVDALRVNMDSASGEGTVAIPYELNLTDQLFRYGVRVNQDYLADLNCGDFPVVAGSLGNQAQVRMLPWPYFPLISNYGSHPSVRNLDAIMLRFASSIDTVKAPGIQKTPLLFTSAYTKMIGPPIQVSFNDLQSGLLPEKFQSGSRVAGYLLEGAFTSLYKNRFPPAGMDRNALIEKGIESKVVVIADGDLIRNELDIQDGTPLRLGVDAYTKTTYANEALLMNLLAYMTDEEGVVLTKSREVTIRPLDKVKVKEERLKWQVINLALPLVFLLLFGVVKTLMRKSKYGKK